MHGHHGLWGKGLPAFEDAQRVPLIIWAPNRFPARGSIEGLVNLVDLPRTFLKQAQTPIPECWQGQDLSPVLEATADTVQDAVLIELRATEKTLNQHTLVTDRFKLVVYKHTEEAELYDLKTDPNQYTNLWNDAAYANERHALLLRLAQFHMEREPIGPKRVSFA